jgi:hypothetical protein
MLLFLTLHYYFKEIIQTAFLPFGIALPFYYPRANWKITIFHHPHLLFSIPLFLRYSLYIQTYPMWLVWETLQKKIYINYLFGSIANIELK